MNIDSARQGKASACSVNLVKIYHELKQESLVDKFRAFFTGKTSVAMYYLTFKFSVTSGTGNTYTVLIRTNPDFSLKSWTSGKVKIYCSCADFKYRSAYKLNKHGSLFKTPSIESSLGMALSDQPKRGTTLLCKHSFAALQWLVMNWSNVMKTI